MKKRSDFPNPSSLRVFVKCFKKALRWYEVDVTGLDQTDLLPTAVALTGFLLDEIKKEKNELMTVYVSRLKNKNRVEAKKFLSLRAHVDSHECLLDIYCCTEKNDPIRPILTIESEGAAEKVSDNSCTDSCDYLWDLFKLLQVDSPLRIFLALCRRKNVSCLEENIDRIVRAYILNRKDIDIVFAVVLPKTKLKGESLKIRRWMGTKMEEQIISF